MASAARLPAPIAATTVAGPETASPPAKTPGEVGGERLRVDVQGVPGGELDLCGIRVVCAGSRGRRRCPMEATTMSKSRSCSDPLMGIGRRRPVSSGSPSSISMTRSPVTLPSRPSTSTGARRNMNRIPSASASIASCSSQGISTRVRR